MLHSTHYIKSKTAKNDSYHSFLHHIFRESTNVESHPISFIFRRDFENDGSSLNNCIKMAARRFEIVYIFRAITLRAVFCIKTLMCLDLKQTSMNDHFEEHFDSLIRSFKNYFFSHTRLALLTL